MKVNEVKSLEIKIGDEIISNNNFTLIAGPCSVESYEMLDKCMENIDTKFIRGGVFKPRTSPYDFQGLKEEGIKIFKTLKQKHNKLIVSEVMSTDQIDLFGDIDIIQIGARNMQNFELLKAVAKTNKPILLKRGLANTVDEFLSSAEYILNEGNQNVILCERGIRTFETTSRFTLDIAAIKVIKQRTALPIFIDPSHAAGDVNLVKSLTLAAVAAGCDGLIIEVHNNPKEALSDANLQLTFEQFKKLEKGIHDVYNLCKTIKEL